MSTTIPSGKDTCASVPWINMRVRQLEALVMDKNVYRQGLGQGCGPASIKLDKERQKSLPASHT
jgi:hypothetical protein